MKECLALAAILAVFWSPSSQKNIVCWLEVEVVGPHLAYLHPNASSPSLIACDLERSDHAIGFLARNNASLSVGVISALVGGNKGWIVTLFEMVQEKLSSCLMEWSFQDRYCWFKLQDELVFNQTSPVLDIGDHLHFQVTSVLNNISISAYLIPRHLGDISFEFDNGSLFDFISSVRRTQHTQTLTIELWQRPIPDPVQSQITFRLQACSPSCQSCDLSIVIFSGCPLGKGLTFSYPTRLNESDFYYLPAPVYKQCQNKTSRSDCNCSERTTASGIGWSDCIQKVYRHLFADDLPLTFSMGLENETETELESLPIVIEELNSRTDYRVTTEPQREIEVSGAGLFHFRANLTSTRSFCPLSTQFTVFVVKQPLTKSEEHLIGTFTAVGCGISILLAYMVHCYFSKTNPSILKHLHMHNRRSR